MKPPDRTDARECPRRTAYRAIAFWVYAAAIQTLFLLHFLPSIARSSATFRRAFEWLPDWLR